MKNLLNVDAAKRFSADKALSHAWFTHQQIFNKPTPTKKSSSSESCLLKNGGFFNFGKHMKQDNHRSSLKSQNMLLDSPESEEPKKSDKETNVFSEKNLNFNEKKNLRVKSEKLYFETSPSEDPNSEKDTNIGSCYTEGDNTSSSLKNVGSLGSKQKEGDITPSSLKSIGGVFPKKYSRKTEN